MFSIEEFVPSDHLLRKIDSAVDYIYDFVEDLYCKDNGRPSVDPVVIFKMVLIQHIYGIPSLSMFGYIILRRLKILDTHHTDAYPKYQLG